MNTFVRRLASDIPLMTEGALAFLMGHGLDPDDIKAAEHPYMQALRKEMKPAMQKVGNLAIVPVQGPIAYNPDPGEMLWDGVEDSKNIGDMLENADDDDDVEGVLLRMDTPGGMMLGGPEIAEKVAGMSKPVVAHIGGMGASLGYMIASQADEVIANKSAIVGSIGVIASVADYTDMLSRIGIKFHVFTNEDAKYKAAGALGTKLTLPQMNQIAKSVESAFGVFKSMVLSRRPQVKMEAMQGQTFRGSEAKEMGLVDRVGDENFALGILRMMVNG